MRVEQTGAAMVTHAVIEVTSRCNYHCSFCAGRHMPQGDMDLRTYSSVLFQLPSLKHLYLSGEGEALLHPHFFKMASTARARGINLYHVTNGSLLSERICSKLIETGFREINISTETVDAGLFRRIRGGDWSQILKNTECLVKARGNLSLPIIRFNFNAFQSTLDQIPGIIELSMAIGIEAPNIFSLQSKVDYARNYPPAIQTEILLPTQRIELVRAVRSSPAPAHFWNTLYTDGDSAPCPFLKRFIWVSHNKAIAPCCYIKDLSGRWGDVRVKYGVDAALKSQELQHLESELNHRRVPQECIGCSVFEFHDGWEE